MKQQLNPWGWTPSLIQLFRIWCLLRLRVGQFPALWRWTAFRTSEFGVGEALPSLALIYKRFILAYKLVPQVCEQRSLPGSDGAAGLRLWGGGKLKSLLLPLTLECQQEKMKVVFCVGFIYLWLFFACCCFNFSLLSFPTTLSLPCSRMGSCTSSQHCRSWLFLIQQNCIFLLLFFWMFCLCVPSPFIFFFFF